ncbi:MAG: DUF3857 and transglutaminase domain-containing protein [Bacteroidia bacterium]|nr:DUF3857 and transglutaminase domain-containing protein [Bacteroidia bacterium]
MLPPFNRIRVAMAVLMGLIAAAPLSAQKEPIKFGKLSESDLAFTRYDRDTSAAAVYLCDYGISSFTGYNSILLNFHRHVRIKILKPEALDLANVSVPLYFRGLTEEKVATFKAITYNFENGAVIETPLEREGKFEDEYSDNLKLYRVTLPNVKVGSIIEYRYDVASEFVFNIQTWNFQHDYPTLYSEYRAQVPDFLKFRYFVNGTTYPFSVSEQTDIIPAQSDFGVPEVRARWVMEHVPVLREEAFVSSMENYRTRVEFEVQSLNLPNRPAVPFPVTWPAIGADLMTEPGFGKALGKGGFLPDSMAKIRALPDEKARIHAIYRMVQHRMKWNNARRFMARQTPEKAWEARTGSAADINLLLVALLREAGFRADPVLLRTRGEGHITRPSTSLVDFVVAAVQQGEQWLLLDATDPGLPPGLLPVRDLNYEGWRVSESGVFAIDLKPKSGHSVQSQCFASISPDGMISGQFQIVRRDYAAISYRAETKAVPAEDHLRELERETGAEISAYQAGPMDSASRTLTESFDFALSSADLQQTGDFIYFNPLLHTRMQENPFTQDKRQYSVEFASPRSFSFSLSMTIPEGYELAETPKDIRFRLPDNSASFLYVTQLNGNMLSVSTQLKITSVLFSPEQYLDLKALYDQIISKHGEPIVFKKI